MKTTKIQRWQKIPEWPVVHCPTICRWAIVRLAEDQVKLLKSCCMCAAVPKLEAMYCPKPGGNISDATVRATKPG